MDSAPAVWVPRPGHVDRARKGTSITMSVTGSDCACRSQFGTRLANDRWQRRHRSGESSARSAVATCAHRSGAVEAMSEGAGGEPAAPHTPRAVISRAARRLLSARREHANHRFGRGG
jgi:hypothetical protein